MSRIQWAREIAVTALGEWQDEQSVAELVAEICNVNDYLRKPDETRNTIVTALSQINPNWQSSEPAQKAIQILVSRLQHESIEKRTEINHILSILGWKSDDIGIQILDVIKNEQWEDITKFKIEAVEPLAELLSDNNLQGHLRKKDALVNILVEIDDPWVIKPLIALIKGSDVTNPNRYPKRSRIPGQSPSPGDPNYGKAFKALAKLGEDAIDAILAEFEDTESTIRADMAFLLADMDDIRAVEPLIIISSDPIWGERSTRLLKDLLNKHVERVNSNNLQQIVALDNVLQAKVVGAGGEEFAAGTKVVNPVDTTELKQIAQKEIDRRKSQN